MTCVCCVVVSRACSVVLRALRRVVGVLCCVIVVWLLCVRVGVTNLGGSLVGMVSLTLCACAWCCCFLCCGCMCFCSV